MENSKLKNKGLLIQLLGLVILIGGMHGFNVFTGVLYFVVLFICVIIFARCLVRGGAIVRKSKLQK